MQVILATAQELGANFLPSIVGPNDNRTNDAGRPIQGRQILVGSESPMGEPDDMPAFLRHDHAGRVEVGFVEDGVVERGGRAKLDGTATKQGSIPDGGQRGRYIP